MQNEHNDLRYYPANRQQAAVNMKKTVNKSIWKTLRFFFCQKWKSYLSAISHILKTGYQTRSGIFLQRTTIVSNVINSGLQWNMEKGKH